MKITCTENEKVQLQIYFQKSGCPFAHMKHIPCPDDKTCRECVEKTFEWEIVKPQFTKETLIDAIDICLTHECQACKYCYHECDGAYVCLLSAAARILKGE